MIFFRIPSIQIRLHHPNWKESSQQKHPLVVKQDKESNGRERSFLPPSSQEKHRVTLVQIQEFEKSGYCWFNRKAKSSYNHRIIEENFDDPKNFWKAVKKVLPNKSVTPQQSAAIEPITVDGKTTTDALTIANGFCTYFTDVVGKLLSSIPPLNWNQLSTEACLNNSSQSLFSLKPVSAAFVHRQLRLLKTSKGTGLDGIIFQPIYLRMRLQASQLR